MLDAVDNCPVDGNASQTDTDADGTGDVCDAFPNDNTEDTDTDGDGVGDNTDSAPNNADVTATNAEVAAAIDAASSSSSGAMNPIGLFALLGLPALLRRFKSKR